MKFIRLSAALFGLAALLPGSAPAGAEPAAYLPAPHSFKRVETVSPDRIEFRLGGETVRPGSFTVKRSLNGNWKFSGVENSAQPFAADAGQEKSYAAPEFDDSKWDDIAVPLDWFQKYPKARREAEPYTRGWYRTGFELTKSELSGRRVILRFDCVGYDAKVFLNGKEAGGHQGDFTPFELDVTDLVRAGKNRLAVRVLSDFGTAFGVKEKAVHAYGSQWWIGNIKGGIWQKVTLSLEPEIRVRRLFAVPNFKDGVLTVEYEILNHTGKPLSAAIETAVTDAMKSNANAVAGTASQTVKLNPGENTGDIRIPLKNPEKWSVNRPYLYWATLAVRENGKVLSAGSVRFGWREFSVRDGQFHLNGERVYLFGENIPSVSYGGYERTAEKEEAMLTEFILGCRNLGYVMLRNAHMPIVPAALEIADECGMMFFNEWAWCFTNSIEPVEFEKRNLRELAEFVEATRNHPSVTMWSLGNEVVHSNRPEVARQMDLQAALVRKMDRQQRPISTFSGQAGWQSYGRTKLDTDVHDLHTYVALSNPWTEYRRGADKVVEGLLEIYGEKERLSRPLVAWENVGFSWGFHDASNKNPDFRRGDVDEYLRYANGKTSWGQPCGIGFAGCMSLAEAVDPKVRQEVPMSRFGRRIFELYRLDDRFNGFAPWFSDPALKTSTLWNQPVFPALRDADGLPPRNLFSGEPSKWTLETVNSSGRAFRNLALELALAGNDGKIRPFAAFPVEKLDGWTPTAQPAEFTLPADLAPGFYQLRLTLRGDGGEVARNYYDIFVQPASLRTGKIAAARPVFVFDTGAAGNRARLEKRLAEAGIPFKTVRNFAGLPADGVVMVPPESVETQQLQLADDPAAGKFVTDGGTLLVFEQKNSQSTVPGNLSLTYDPICFSDPVLPDHPVFAGLTARNLDTWNSSPLGYVIVNNYAPITANVVAAKGPKLGRKDVGMALAEAKLGKGLLLYSQLEAFAAADRDSSAARYLANLIAYAAGREYRPGVRPLVEASDHSYTVEPEREVFLDLSAHANRGFRDDVDDDGEGGWTDQGSNDFRMMPLGVQRAAGVRFNIIDPDKNAGKSCLVARGTARMRFPEAFRQIPVGRKLSRIFFLHTAAWGGQPEAGRYRIHYADGKSADIVLEGNRNIGDWWNTARLPEARAGIVRENPAGYNVGTFVMEWENPRPDVEIRSFDFLSALAGKQTGEIDYLPTATAIPVLVAVTGETYNPDRIDIAGSAFEGAHATREADTGTPGRAAVRKEDGKQVIDIAFPEVAATEMPVAFLRFRPENPAPEYRTLVIRAKSRTGGTIDVVLPEKDWKGAMAGYLRLSGDGKYHTYRLTVGKDFKLRWGKFDFRSMRPELFFYDRGPGDPSQRRPAVEFTVSDAVLE